MDQEKTRVITQPPYYVVGIGDEFHCMATMCWGGSSMATTANIENAERFVENTDRYSNSIEHAEFLVDLRKRNGLNVRILKVETTITISEI